MSRLVSSLALLLALSGAARADDKSGVRPTTTTVEVLDDKAQIDDVISRLRQPPAEPKRQDPARQSSDLKQDRPPLSTVTPPEPKKSTVPETKKEHWRREHRERGSSLPERTERPRHGK